ncbi:MAG: VWA domain-containing protein [Rhodobacteraceae bacterium]|nr:VWA domain-containing protein [Paracoccaceae bacterium]
MHEPEGRLVDNIIHFSRALRKAGVAVGTSQVRNAIEAVGCAGFTKRQDFYYTLRATLINRPEHLQIYHQVFNYFWRDPEFLERMLKMMLPLVQAIGDEDDTAAKPAERRAAEALADQRSRPSQAPDRQVIEIEAHQGWSDSEMLRSMDFEQMSAAEVSEAVRAVQRMTFPVEPLRTRRHMSSSSGHVPDVRTILKRALRKGGDIDRLALKKPRLRPPNLVALCDISGSMSVYSRMMVHFLHAVAWSPNPGWGKVHGFTFGTQLTNITRALHQKDVDQALAAVGREASDWQGGTRIGESLRSFNNDWSRRMLGQGAVVLLITDGLERGNIERLKNETERLALSCRRLIWLNPLLRWSEFTPKAAGVRAILPYVDSFHSCHSLDSLSDLSAALSHTGEKQRLLTMV